MQTIQTFSVETLYIMHWITTGLEGHPKLFHLTLFWGTGTRKHNNLPFLTSSTYLTMIIFIRSFYMTRRKSALSCSSPWRCDHTFREHGHERARKRARPKRRTLIQKDCQLTWSWISRPECKWGVHYVLRHSVSRKLTILLNKRSSLENMMLID